MQAANMRIRRTELLRLTGLTRERFDQYANAGQLALSNDETDPGYTWFEALLQIAIDDLSDAPKMERGSATKEPICAIAPALAARCFDIVNSAEDPTLPEIAWVRLIHRHSDE